MADKKPAPDKNTNSAADSELVQRVDAMMSPRQPAPKPVAPGPIIEDAASPQRLDSDPAPLDIFAGLKTAPEVPKNLLKIIRSKPAKVPSAPEATKPEPVAPPTSVAVTENTSVVPVTDQTSQPPAVSVPEPAIPAHDIEVPPLAIDDAASDAAVNDIVAKEADTVLAAEDAKAGQVLPERAAAKRVERQKIKQRRKLPKKLLLIIPVVALITVLAYPLSRYAMLSLFLKQNLTIVVEDATSQTPVTNADVTFHGISGTTDASGKVVLHAPVGKSTLTVSKRYYQPLSREVTLSELGGTAVKLPLTATGRQVPVTLVNRLTDKPVANASITAAGITAKADAAGHATIVLPTKDDLQDAVIKAPGFNDLTAKIEVTAKDVPGNHLKLTPTGSVYFLSNLNGTIDVLKSNLDGSGRKTVLTGSGKEDKASTSLVASHDWKYVLLASKRNGTMALFLIDTTNDKVTQFDQTPGDYHLIGWSGHNFVYDIVKSTVTAAQNGHEVLKAYNADTQQLNQLDQTSSTGDSTNYAYETYNDISLMQKQLIYTVRWQLAAGVSVDLKGKQDVIRTVQATGSGRKDLQQFDASAVADLQTVRPKPQVVAFAVTSATDSSKTYYRFDAQTGSVLADNGASDLFGKTYPLYLPSPSGAQVLWADTQNGHSSVLVGDQNAGSPVTVLSYTDFRPFAWFSDSYLLFRNADGEIYAASVQANPQPKKVTDYLKTTTIINEYGGL